MQSLLERLLGRTKKESEDTAGAAKRRLSLILHSDDKSGHTKELEERLRKTVIEFYQEKGIVDKVNIEDMSHQLSEEGWVEFSVPLPSNG